MQMINCTKPNS